VFHVIILLATIAEWSGPGMPTVELRMGDIQWPEKCCRCGTGGMSYRTHCEDVITRSGPLGSSQKQEITLANVPVCDRCADAQMVWVGFGILAVAAGGIAFFLIENSDRLFPWVFALIILGIGMAEFGLYKAPIRILKFDEGRNAITVKIYDRDVADEMSRRELLRQNSVGGALL
jgi:hypothetical protein